MAASLRSRSPDRRSRVSNVQSSPWWPNSAPATSKGMASAGISSAGAKRNSASGSMKRLMSQADAMRSTWGRGRVVQRHRGLALALPWRRETHLHGLAGALGLALGRSVEEIDIAKPVHFAAEPAQLLGEPRPAALEEPPIALGQRGIVGIARFLEEPDHVGLLHVLDLVHLEQGGLTAVLLDLLGEPLKLLVAVGGEGKEIGRALDGHRAQGA